MGKKRKNVDETRSGINLVGITTPSGILIGHDGTVSDGRSYLKAAPTFCGGKLGGGFYCFNSGNLSSFSNIRDDVARYITKHMGKLGDSPSVKTVATLFNDRLHKDQVTDGHILLAGFKGTKPRLVCIDWVNKEFKYMRVYMNRHVCKGPGSELAREAMPLRKFEAETPLDGYLEKMKNALVEANKGVYSKNRTRLLLVQLKNGEVDGRVLFDDDLSKLRREKEIRDAIRAASGMARVPPALPSPSPPLTKFKIAMCQLSITADKVRNIRHARKAIRRAAKEGAALVLLPEIWNCPYSNDSFPVYAEDIDAGDDASPSTAMLSEAARRFQITIVGGSIPERSGDKLYNTCCVFGTDGKLIAKHREIHLFDVDIPDITFKKSETLTAGGNPTVVDTDVGRIGVGIGYDIGFQELSTICAARGAHLLCYPGAFNMVTGPLHWELLQRARAADNQVFVVTCSPARSVGSDGVTVWGHSTLVGPSGEILATTQHEEATVISEIDYSLFKPVRRNLRLQEGRRGDVYQLVDVKRI